MIRERIVLIGAGSTVFTRGLVADLIRRGAETDLALVDVDPHALDVAERLATKMITARTAPITLSADVERRRLLPGATAVICTVGVGGRRGWERDVFIPRTHGINMPVGDTVGPGGSSRALRMIPAMVAIARDARELAPSALFFNYGNPMAPVCRAIHRATGVPVMGLCHGVAGVARYIEDALGVARGSLRSTAVGINHLTWFVETRVGGVDVMPRLRAIAAARSGRLPATDPALLGAEPTPFDDPTDNPFSWELLHRFGAFPAALDRHVTEFFPQFFREGGYYGKTLGVDAFSFEGTIARGDGEFAQMAADARAPGPLPPDYFDRMEGEHEQVIEIIDAIRGEQGRVFSVNLPNTGQAPNLPPDVIVEGPAVADGAGLRAIAQPPLPAALVGTLVGRYMWVETIVEAALEGSRDKFIQALVLDGAVRSLDEAVILADELLRAHGGDLPWVAAALDRPAVIISGGSAQ